ncbi:unnamed protein product, partial [Coffea canephora]
RFELRILMSIAACFMQDLSVEELCPRMTIF